MSERYGEGKEVEGGGEKRGREREIHFQVVILNGHLVLD